MPVKWLACKVQFYPEGVTNKRYACSYTDYYGRTITLKVGAENVYVDYMGPPGAPYICSGQLRVELHDVTVEKAVILLPARGSHDDNVTYVPSSAIEFKPPVQFKTVCMLRKR